MSHTSFAEKLIKGKVAEIVFELMFRQAGYQVTHFGYEYTASEFIRDEIREVDDNEEVLNEIRHSPDFIITTPDNHVHFVEVKFQSELRQDFLLKMAHKTHARWSHAWYFVATRKGFYFNSCERLIEKEGDIDPLKEDVIPIQVQEEYQDVLNKFSPHE